MPGDSKASNSEIASSVNQTDNPLSANATITIIMTTPPLPANEDMFFFDKKTFESSEYQMLSCQNPPLQRETIPRIH